MNNSNKDKIEKYLSTICLKISEDYQESKTSSNINYNIYKNQLDQYILSNKIIISDKHISDIIFNYFRSSSEIKIGVSIFLLTNLIENQKISKVSIVKFMPYFLKVVKRIKNKSIMKLMAHLYSLLLNNFSTGLYNFIDEQIRHILLEITENYQKLDDEKEMYLLLLNETLFSRPYLVLKEIKENQLLIYLRIISNEKSDYLNLHLEFIENLIKEISKLELDDQKNLIGFSMTRLIKDVKDYKKSNKNLNSIILYYFVNYIFKYVSPSFFNLDEYNQLYESIMSTNPFDELIKNDMILDIFMQMMYSIIVYNSPLFYKCYLLNYFESLSDLLDLINEQKIDFIFDNISQIFKLYKTESISNLAEFFFDKTLKYFENNPYNKNLSIKGAQVCLLEILYHFNNVHKNNEFRINNLIDLLLINYFNIETIKILQFFHNSDDILFNAIIETKLKLYISFILKKNTNNSNPDLKNIEITNYNSDSEDQLDNSFDEVLIQLEAEKNLKKKENQNLVKTIDDLNNLNNKTINEFERKGTINKNIENSPTKNRSILQVNKKSCIKDFLTKVEQNYNSQKFNSDNEKKISIALEALARFNFKKNISSKKSNFIKETVLAYLSSESTELRTQAAKIVFKLSFENEEAYFESNLNRKNIQSIVNRMILIAQNDPEERVRIETLIALNSLSGKQFIPFVNGSDNIQRLIDLNCDSNPSVRKQSIIFLLKLIPMVPELINRFDQILFRAISVLSSSLHLEYNDNEMIVHLKLIIILLKNAKYQIKGKITVIASLIIELLKKKLTYYEKNKVIIKEMLKELLKCLYYLFERDSLLCRKYFDAITELFCFSMNNLEDSLLYYFIKNIIVLVKWSGFQLLLLSKSNILKFIFQFLERYTNLKNRIIILKLIGTLGAVDPILISKFESFRNKGQLSIQSSKNNIVYFLLSIQNYNFYFVDFIKNDFIDLREIQMKENYDNFKHNIKLVESSLGRGERNKNQISLLQIKENISENKDGVSFENNNLLFPKFIQQNVLDYEEEFKRGDFIMNRNNSVCLNNKENLEILAEDELFYLINETVLKLLLLNIINTKEEDVLLISLDCLENILYLLAKHCFKFQEIIFQPLISIFNDYSNKNNIINIKKRVLQVIKSFILVNDSKFVDNISNVDEILKLIIKNLKIYDFRTELFEICNLLLNFKIFLRHRFKDVVSVLINIFFVDNDNQEENLNDKVNTLTQILQILMRLNEQEYLHQINPVFLRVPIYLNEKISICNVIQNKLIDSCFDFFKSIMSSNYFYHFSGNIIRCVIQIKKDFPDKKIKSQDFLFEIVRFLGEKSINIINLIAPHMEGYPKFQDLLEELEENSFFSYSSNNIFISNNISSIEINENNKKEHKEQSDSPISELFNRNFDFKIIKEAFFVFSLGKSISWEDWLQRLTSELISQSPCLIIVSCKPLIFFPEVIKLLFKPAFLILWTKLCDNQKQQLSQGFNTIFNFSTKIPLKIRQEIIELVEIMIREEQTGFSIDCRKVADFALKCHNIHRAIYFKEQEFMLNPASAIESLLKLYSELGLKTSSEGLVEFAQKSLGLILQVGWLKSMGHWNKIHKEDIDDSKEDSELQLMCNLELSNWEWSLKRVSELLGENKNLEIEIQKKLKAYGAKAAFHLGDWDKLESFIDPTQDNREIYLAAVALKHDKMIEASEYIEQAFKLCEKESYGIGNYATDYDKIVKLQLLCEMNEILDLKNKSINDSFVVESNINSNENITNKDSDERNHLLGIWNDRFLTMENGLSNMQKILAIRSLICNEEELLTWKLKFAKICFKQENSVLYTQTINRLKNFDFKSQILIDKIALAQVECEYKTGKLQQLQVIGLIDELTDKKGVSKKYKSLLYVKLGIWLMKNEAVVENKYKKVIEFLNKALNDIKEKPKVWHYYAIANYYLFNEKTENENENIKINLLKKSIESFAKAISLEINSNGKYTIQDLLRFLDLWYEHHDSKNIEIRECLEKSVDIIRNKDWILIYGPILARVEQKESFTTSAKKILTNLARDYPQILIFPLLVARRSNVTVRSKIASRILLSLQETHQDLINDARLFADELIRVSVLFEEQWYHGFGEAIRYKHEGNMQMVTYILNTLFNNTTKNINKPTINETAFFYHYGATLKRAEEFLVKYHESNNEIYFLMAWDLLSNFHKQLENVFKSIKGNLFLENVSPLLISFKNTKLLVPGVNRLFSLKSKEIYIESIEPVLKYLNSKRKPRKLSLLGSNGRKYSYLLKGNEDLRQDERVVQLMLLMNELLKNASNYDNLTMKITTFHVLPLSYNCGIISWLENSDPIFELVKNQREQKGISANCEKKLLSTLCENYDMLSKLKKLELFLQIQDHIKADELKKVLWLQSSKAETWISRRQAFIGSTAVMSIIGYILGLGDRHLMNIMLEKNSGRIVHIDFGDCFESASLRDKLPEKVPFRLTRLLVNAMDVCGTEGTFKSTCEIVMKTMRENKEVILALLEEFICDPIISWRLGNETLSESGTDLSNSSIHVDKIIDNSLKSITIEDSFKNEGVIETEVKIQLIQKQLIKKDDKNSMDNRAYEALVKVKNKLNGKEFCGEELDHKAQVKRLIKEATSSENLCQMFSGWNPFL
jgi:FKBP12-rapamycin complex-associated protein